MRRKKLMNSRHQPTCGKRGRHGQVQRHHMGIYLDRQRRCANMPERLTDLTRITDARVGQDNTLAIPHEKYGAQSVFKRAHLAADRTLGVIQLRRRLRKVTGARSSFECNKHGCGGQKPTWNSHKIPFSESIATKKHRYWARPHFSCRKRADAIRFFFDSRMCSSSSEATSSGCLRMHASRMR